MAIGVDAIGCVGVNCALGKRANLWALSLLIQFCLFHLSNFSLLLVYEKLER